MTKPRKNMLIGGFSVVKHDLEIIIDLTTSSIVQSKSLMHSVATAWYVNKVDVSSKIVDLQLAQWLLISKFFFQTSSFVWL